MSGIFVGVDPGMAGSLAALHSDGRVEVIPMPIARYKRKNHPTKDSIDGDAIKRWLRALGPQNIKWMVIEKAIVLPRQGLVSGSKFVGGQRYVTGLAHGLDINCDEIMPAMWKRAMKLGQGNLKDKKAVSIARCQELFPEADIRKHSKLPGKRLDTLSHDMAEAVLLAYFARERIIGNL